MSLKECFAFISLQQVSASWCRVTQTLKTLAEVFLRTCHHWCLQRSHIIFSSHSLNPDQTMKSGIDIQHYALLASLTFTVHTQRAVKDIKHFSWADKDFVIESEQREPRQENFCELLRNRSPLTFCRLLSPTSFRGLKPERICLCQVEHECITCCSVSISRVCRITQSAELIAHVGVVVKEVQ